MAIYSQLFFQESQLAHRLLDGKKGLEVGGGRHNQWGLDVTNVDRYPGMDTPYKLKEIELCGQAMPVDIVAPGDRIPVGDKSFDFVISSHVIEHIWDVIGALKEWERIAREFIYIIVPQGGEFAAHAPDRGKLLTSFDELQARHSGKAKDPGTDDHHSRWTSETFVDLCNRLGYTIHTVQDPDDKVGNGFCVVLDVRKVIVDVPVIDPSASKKSKK